MARRFLGYRRSDYGSAPLRHGRAENGARQHRRSAAEGDGHATVGDPLRALRAAPGDARAVRARPAAAHRRARLRPAAGPRRGRRPAGLSRCPVRPRLARPRRARRQPEGAGDGAAPPARPRGRDHRAGAGLSPRPAVCTRPSRRRRRRRALFGRDGRPGPRRRATAARRGCSASSGRAASARPGWRRPRRRPRARAGRSPTALSFVELAPLADGRMLAAHRRARARHAARVVAKRRCWRRCGRCRCCWCWTTPSTCSTRSPRSPAPARRRAAGRRARHQPGAARPGRRDRAAPRRLSPPTRPRPCFAARVRAVDPASPPAGEDAAALARICRRLDGIPLAIELAAARVPLLGVQGVERKLGEALALLSRGAQDAPPRQQTLRAALQWSHALLDDAQKKVFRRLGVFSGSFAPETARAGGRRCRARPLGRARRAAVAGRQVAAAAPAPKGRCRASGCSRVARLFARRAARRSRRDRRRIAAGMPRRWRSCSRPPTSATTRRRRWPG